MTKAIALGDIRDVSLLGDRLLQAMYASMWGKRVPIGQIREINEHMNQLRAKEAHGTDPELKVLERWVRTGGLEPDLLREEAKRILHQDPASGLGYFYTALAEAALGKG